MYVRKYCIDNCKANVMLADGAGPAPYWENMCGFLSLSVGWKVYYISPKPT